MTAEPQFLLLPVAVRDGVVGVLLEGNWTGRPLHYPLAAVEALRNLALADPPEDHTLPRKEPLRRGLPPDGKGMIREAEKESLAHRSPPQPSTPLAPEDIPPGVYEAVEEIGRSPRFA